MTEVPRTDQFQDEEIIPYTEKKPEPFKITEAEINATPQTAQDNTEILSITAEELAQPEDNTQPQEQTKTPLEEQIIISEAIQTSSPVDFKKIKGMPGWQMDLVKGGNTVKAGIKTAVDGAKKMLGK